MSKEIKAAIGSGNVQVLEAALASTKKVAPRELAEILNDLVHRGEEPMLRVALGHFRPKIDWTLVYLAARSQKPQVLRVLKEFGADMNVVDESPESERSTVVQATASLLGADFVRLMVELGADLNVRNVQGETALMTMADRAAADQAASERMKRLRPDLWQPPEAEAILRTMLGLGADATLTDNFGHDALDHYRFAVTRQEGLAEDTGTIQLLRKAGCKGHRGFIELYHAVENGDVAAADEAIKSGADVHQLSPSLAEPRSFLTMAAERGDLEMVNLLLGAGADANRADGRTRPAIAAAEEGQLQVLQRLVEAGADLSLKDPRPRASDLDALTPYEAAEWAGQKQIMKYLKSIGADRAAEDGSIKPGVQVWENFAEVLIKCDVPAAAKALAKLIGGEAHIGCHGRSFKVGNRSFIIARLRGMAWSNVFQVAPPMNWLMHAKEGEELAAELARTAGVSALYVAYSDTSDAANSARFEPAGGKPKRKVGRESRNDWLASLAQKENFVLSAFVPPRPKGGNIEVLIPNLGQDRFDGIGFVTT